MEDFGRALGIEISTRSDGSLQTGSVFSENFILGTFWGDWVQESHAVHAFREQRKANSFGIKIHATPFFCWPAPSGAHRMVFWTIPGGAWTLKRGPD